MSDETSAVISAARKDWVTEHRDLYLSSGGTKGHVMDITAVGGPALGTHCLIRYTGRKSGNTFITGLCYGVVGGEVVIIASKGGADHHPAWYLNIREQGTVDFQVATEAFRATWREPEGTERDKAWAHMVDNFAFYADYQKSTRRTIPLVMLKPIESIPVFKAGDTAGMRQN